jgi:hypothetical protein
MAECIRFFFIDENLGRYATSFTTERSPAFSSLRCSATSLRRGPLVAICALTAMATAGIR